jgi:hypothetical protein
MERFDHRRYNYFRVTQDAGTSPTSSICQSYASGRLSNSRLSEEFERVANASHTYKAGRFDYRLKVFMQRENSPDAQMGIRSIGVKFHDNSNIYKDDGLIFETTPLFLEALEPRSQRVLINVSRQFGGDVPEQYANCLRIVALVSNYFIHNHGVTMRGPLPSIEYGKIFDARVPLLQRMIERALSGSLEDITDLVRDAWDALRSPSELLVRAQRVSLRVANLTLLEEESYFIQSLFEEVPGSPLETPSMGLLAPRIGVYELLSIYNANCRNTGLGQPRFLSSRDGRSGEEVIHLALSLGVDEGSDFPVLLERVSGLIEALGGGMSVGHVIRNGEALAILCINYPVRGVEFLILRETLGRRQVGGIREPG